MQVALAYVVAREVFDLHDFVAEVEALDNQVPTRAQTALYLEFRRLMDRAVRWLLQSRPPITDLAAEIERFASVVTPLRRRCPRCWSAPSSAGCTGGPRSWSSSGLPEELAPEAASLLDVYSLLDIAEIATTPATGRRRRRPMYFMLSERFQVDTMLALITALPRDDRWDALARAALRYDLYAALEQLTVSVISSTDPGEPQRADRGLGGREPGGPGPGARHGRGGRHLDRTGIAALSVALRGLRGRGPERLGHHLASAAAGSRAAAGGSGGGRLHSAS